MSGIKPFPPFKKVGTVISPKVSGDSLEATPIGQITPAAGSFTSVTKTTDNLNATAAPTVNDDINAGYVVGSKWIDVSAGDGYVCLDNTAGAAVWKITTGGGAVATKFTDLSDTPSSYAGQAGLFPKVNATEDGVVFASGAGGDTLPVVDTTTIAKGSADATKQVRFEVDGITTGATRVLTVPDKNVTIADNADLTAHIADVSNPHSVTATQVNLGNVPNLKVNLSATVAPTVSDDSTAEYSIGSYWVDTTADKAYICLDAASGAAVWTETTVSIPAESFSSSVAHATTDADAGKAFTIASFPSHAQITKIRVRADWTAGQQANTGTALVNNAAGIAPADTSIAFDTSSATFAVGDYVFIDNECVYISANSGTVLTVTRGVKGTKAAYHDDNATITKANHGVRLVLFKDTNRNYAERIIELSSIMTYSGTTDAAITASDDYFGLTADIQNVGHNDFVVIEDTVDEVCRVQNVNHNVVSATYDYTIFVQDGLTAHTITKAVKKLMVYDLDTPYNSGTTLYGTIFIDEAIAGTVNVDVEVFTDSYT